MKKILLLATISLTLLLNACSKDDALSYNYNPEYKADGQTSYIQWFYWTSIVSVDAGAITSIDGRVWLTKVPVSSPIVPTRPAWGIGSADLYAPHYELVARIKFQYNGKYVDATILELISDWQYAYGQFEDTDDGRQIFRIFELYDELPE